MTIIEFLNFVLSEFVAICTSAFALKFFCIMFVHCLFNLFFLRFMKL